MERSGHDCFAAKHTQAFEFSNQVGGSGSREGDNEDPLGRTPSSNNLITRRSMAKNLPVPGPALTRRGLLFVAAILRTVPERPARHFIVSVFHALG
jgi:hypothetical protein